MRRQVLLWCLAITVSGGPLLSAQTIWSPCGCPDQGSPCQTNNCQSGECQSDCQGCNRGWCGQFHDPTYFQPWEVRPFGVYNERIYEAHRQSGVRGQMVFYRHHFSLSDSDGTWQLTDAGRENVQKITRLWTRLPTQILIESLGNQDWDNARRDVAMNAIAGAGVAVTPEVFVIGKSHILGLVPNEPDSIFQRRQQISPYFYGYLPSGAASTDGSSNSSSTSGGSGSSPFGIAPRNP